ncbi:GNAT family N-acetyltransferase [Flexivirga caeni]|uniref:GNAT family N-acetyltransferase n=1 Tax=Flexivirga caeni TaxID=2294115 RepID=A0A3M9LZV5_9MICO|nr:GNAT family N-acetyltransferase [Flexivirga caeni]RNI18153.1 GNAT family N-acetyltransferase [Flexivirga caeni]
MKAARHCELPEVSVVRVEPDGWERYRAVRLAALQDAPEMFGSTYEREIAFDEGEWRRRAERPATFLAVRDGVDVGIAGAYEFDAGWCVMGMWLHPDARGTGAVDLLLAACADVAVGCGAWRLALWVMADNPRGIRAYERGGFAFTGERELGRDGRWELAMARTLS